MKYFYGYYSFHKVTLYLTVTVPLVSYFIFSNVACFCISPMTICLLYMAQSHELVSRHNTK